MDKLIWLSIIVALASWMLTGLLRRYARAKNLLDIPNKRSSHSFPTPRGGGLAIVVSFLIALLVLTMIDQLDQSLVIGLFGAGALVAIIGFVDDHRHIAARWRLIAHFVAAGWLLFWLGGLPPSLSSQVMMLDFTWLASILAMLYLVWLLNLYNFMDGIDGIACIEAISVCLGSVVLYWLNNSIDNTWILPALLLAAVAGFLIWNFPHAKIFMGDVGSGFLGLMLGALSIQAAWIAPKLFWSWLILLGVFLVDATITLLRRALRKEKIYEAHRSHAYQYAARQLNSHIRVSLGIGLINLVWLLPIAVIVVLDYLEGIRATVIAYIPLILLALYFKAGQSEVHKA